MIRNRILWISISLFILVCILYTGYLIEEYYSLADEILTQKATHTNEGDSLIVIFIGDSWASYHSQYDQHLKTCIETKVKKPTKVISKGTVGAKTKFIYTNMHDYSLLGTKSLIDISPDYAIISAGINDAVAKMGTDNYCHHYNLIIKELLSAGIKPIILDMPQVDYRAIYQRESWVAQKRHRISAWYTGAPFWSFDDYKSTLRAMISHEEKRKKLIYISASEWNPDGFRDPRYLYLDDHVHLNEKGYFLLDSCIASKIYHDIMSTHDSQ